jgi:thiamine-phosphate pyrophosphorylase
VNQHPTDERTDGRTDVISGLYAIVDSGFCPPSGLAALARRLIEGGCRLLQLRMKGSDAAHVERVAREIMAERSRHSFTFIVNDRAEVALAVGADGVHVGTNDEPIEAIRKRVGSKLLIGYSAHSQEEAVAAASQGADYVAFGAIFPTATKGPDHPVQGLTRLAEVVRATAAPVVAIGGIGRENVRQVIEAGASAAAMIGALARAPDAALEARWFVDAIERRAGDA